ncbi:uncharacterized protein LOC131686249 [Topomyia yanbarensis]|uniref:uncharacterized protein LOC131686249 n=1 Tax=Topomyia yanbarensis TaxID=2498891 RepID=UPI00273A7FA8|nr:uncharacterized protein LOC131686249 [Topomyia yanbarensis]
MFHQIRICDRDKQSQRFLWRDHPEQPPQIFVMDVATFGATCSPCSAQFIKNKNALEFEARFPRAVHAIVDNHYVDDFLDSVDTVDEAVRLCNEVKHIHLQAGFEIRNFVSNSSEVLLRLGENNIPRDIFMNLEQSGTERVLGMTWKPTVDVFTFETATRDDIKTLVDSLAVPTKRQVLRTIMSLFDPSGLVAHFIIHGKTLMQEIWRTGTDWDQEIPENLCDSWYRWSGLLTNLDQVQVPRCYFSGASCTAPDDLQIHVFVDASETAYASVAYLRFVDNGKPRCVLVGAKTKVAPLKPLSIPKLELQAPLLGSRLLNKICTSLSLPIKKRFLWSDSSTALAWIKSSSHRYHQFVAFRVGEILSLSCADEWQYVPTKHNVADEATKWGSGPEFKPQSRWFVGPDFFIQTEQNWPTQSKQAFTTEEELRPMCIHREMIQKPLMDIERFSNWNRLLRSTAYVLRAARRFQKQTLSGRLTSEELCQAENQLWKQVQMQSYPDEYVLLLQNQSHPNKRTIEASSVIYQDTPCMDKDGVIRMYSRIGAAPNAAYDTKYPIILPQLHRVTDLLINSYHIRYLHGNNETVFNEMRQRFRIPHLREAIKRATKNCQHCRIYKTMPRAPLMAPLPEVRLTPYIRPFTHTGVDYFGPILVKQGRSLVKRWVALFTCLTVRAVHLEIVHSLSTESCVMAIRRFVARKGAPATFYSDNGTNFTGAASLLVKQIRGINEQCADTFTNSKTTWKFNPPLTPHMGGPWERMVRSVKAAMAVIAGHPCHPSDEVLETITLESEAIVNSRPLTYLPLDSWEQEALTPNHFLLYGLHGITQPLKPVEVNGQILRDSWKLAQHLVDLFWKRWVREYLPMLTRRTKWFQPSKPLKPGDIVVVVEDQKRNGWLRGRIIKVIHGKDGQVRRAVVQTTTGQMTRPAIKLALLDVGGEQHSTNAVQLPEIHGRGIVDKTSGISAEYSGVNSGHAPRVTRRTVTTTEAGKIK